MTTVEIILSIITTLFGAGNIWQFTTLRSMKRKSSAEADQAQIETLNVIISSLSKNYDTLQDRYDKLQDKYDKLIEKFDEQQKQLLELKSKMDSKSKK